MSESAAANVKVQKLWNLLQEADQPRQFDIGRAELNVQQYLGAFGDDADTVYGHSAFIINKTQLAVMAGTQIQTEKSPKEIITARESSRSTEPWMTRKALMTIRALEEQGHISFEEDVFAEPTPTPEAAELAEVEYEETTPVETQGFVFEQLDWEPDAQAFEVSEAFVERVKLLMQPWESALTPGLPMAPALMPEDFIAVDDDMAAKVIANNNAVLWDRSNGNRWLFENVNNNGIIGWQFFLYQWDEEECQDVVYNVHPRHIWLPPEATSIEDAQYAILRDPVSREQAIARYPDLEDAIKKYMPKKGDEEMMGGESELGNRYPVGAPWRDTTMMRSMIDIWTLWERGHLYPMRVADAIKSGRVRKEENRLVTEDGQPTNPKAKNWPKKRGVRQIQYVADQVADDRQCPYWDIPLGLNKNVLIPFRWVGQGDPQRLEWLDRLIMKLASCLFDIVRYSRSPQIIIPDDLYEALRGQRETMASHPQRLMHVEAEVYNRYKDFFLTGQGFYVKTMPFPEGGMELLQEMLRLHDVLSGNTAELQGRQSGSDMSGVAIQTLQSAARGIIGYKATNTEAMLVRLARLRIDAQMTFMPIRMWKEINDQYPVEVLAAIKRRAKVTDLDLKIEVSSGAGELRKMEQLQAREDFDNGRISHETMLERIDEDVEQEQQRLAKQMAAQAAAQPQQVATQAA